MLSSKMTQINSLQQGIVTILRSGSDRSIRRTFSADMSSTKWLQNNGMKKILSSHQLPLDFSSSDDSDDEFQTVKKPEPLDLWTSILQSKKNDGNDNSTPFLLKKSLSAGFTETSLEVCTESLGSETGSDCFTSEPPPQRQFVKMKYRKSTESSTAPPPPPPLRSIVGDGSGDSLRIESRRENGRLVMEAVPVPPRNYFRAHRGNGRLVLSLIGRSNPKLEEEEEEDEIESVEEAIRQEKEFESVNSMIITAPVVKKLLRRKDEIGIPKSLPPPPRVVPPPSWRNSTSTAVGFIGGGNGFENRYLIGGCKEGRIRPLLIRGQTYCVATS